MAQLVYVLLPIDRAHKLTMAQLVYVLLPIDRAHKLTMAQLVYVLLPIDRAHKLKYRLIRIWNIGDELIHMNVWNILNYFMHIIVDITTTLSG